MSDSINLVCAGGTASVRGDQTPALRFSPHSGGEGGWSQVGFNFHMSIPLNILLRISSMSSQSLVEPII